MIYYYNALHFFDVKAKRHNRSFTFHNLTAYGALRGSVSVRKLFFSLLFCSSKKMSKYFYMLSYYESMIKMNKQNGHKSTHLLVSRYKAKIRSVYKAIGFLLG